MLLARSALCVRTTGSGKGRLECYYFLHSEQMLLEDMGIFFFILHAATCAKGSIHTVSRRLDMRSVGLGGEA
jgi:hypothetical protein